MLRYPANAKTYHQLTPFQQIIKVARHTASSADCDGYRPPKDVKLVRDTVSPGIKPEDDDDDDDGLQSEWVVAACRRCGLDVVQHAALESQLKHEKLRRIKVAVRLDELLQDQAKLLDFDYLDPDITSLRKQMRILGSSESLADGLSPSSQLSPAPESPRPALTNGTPMSSTPLVSHLHRKRKACSPNQSRSSSREREASVATSSRLSSPEVAATPHSNSRQPSVVSHINADGAADHFTKRRKLDTKRDSILGDRADSSKNDTHQADAEEAQAAKPQQQQPEQQIVGEVQEPQPKSAASAVEEGVAPRRERPAVIEERTGLIQFRIVSNDGNPESMILLTGLKNIFQRQLPKMPREYITRLVFDRNHQSLAIVKRGLQVVGGITYRPFVQRKFAEIVFCAITSTEQVKGYGSHLMNHLKDHVKAASPIMHFLTYADNYAIGYFKKQGFTKEITLDREIWVGYIKDYEGGTLMQCSMVSRVAYLQVQEILEAQKEAVLAKIREISKSHVIHAGLEVMRDREKLIKAKGLVENPDGTVAKPERPTKKDNDDSNPTATFLISPRQVPGLGESGWTPEMDELSRRPKRGPHFAVMRHILVELNNHGSAWPFVNPVNGEEVADYYEVIKNPMDLSTMESKLENNQYANVDELVKDAQLIFDNCRTYNPTSSPYAKSATKLEKFLRDVLLPKVQSSL